jgi:ribosome-associated protein
MIGINRNLSISEDELEFSFSRSSGPGGQNVNKVSSRVTLLFDVANSQSLTDTQRRRIHAKLKTRINSMGVLRVVCQKYRNQSANRDEAIARFADLLRVALKRNPPRKKTKVPQTAIDKRIEEKKRQSRIKQNRAKKIAWDE